MNKNYQPMISVVIPAYNRALNIKQCVNSVLKQTVGPFEIIIIDDCSKDQTAQVVQSIKDSRVRLVLLEQNSGAQVARNRGIKESNGDWIAFHDSDDEWLPEKLEKQIRILSEINFNPFTVVHTNYFRRYVKSGKTEVWKLPIIEGKNVYPILLSHPGPAFPGILTSKEALEKVGYLDDKVPAYQEWDTSIRLAKYCRFIHMEEPLFIYNIHEGETISKNKSKDILGYQYIIYKYENDIKTYCGEATWTEHLFIQLNKCLNYKKWLEADEYIKKLSYHKSAKFRFLKLCRRFHLRPTVFSKVKKLIKSIHN